MDNETVFKGWYYVMENTAHGPRRKLLGVGGSGSVFEIQKKRGIGNRGAKSALKVISIPHDENEIRQYLAEGYDRDEIRQIIGDQKDKAKREQELLIQLKNKSNIVHIEDFAVKEKEDGIGWNLYIRMERLKSIDEQMISIRKGETESFSEARVIALGIEICSALDRCHKAGILHRDIKPGNIFVDMNGYYKLGDFGISRVMDETTGIMSGTKTDWYAAPEVLRFEKCKVTADIYSLGLVMYELLNDGRLPFLPPVQEQIGPNDREKSMIQRMRGEQIPPIAGVSKKMNEILLKACAFDPDDRFASASKMSHSLVDLSNAKNDSIKQCEIGDEYFFGRGVERDVEEAAKWYAMSAERGYAVAQYNLGLMYETGHGVEKDEKKSMKYYRMAAEQGHAPAEYKLGLMYETGHGVDRSDYIAGNWYRKAAKQGNADANFRLGLNYENREAYPDALKWYFRAQELGHKEASRRIDALKSLRR